MYLRTSDRRFGFVLLIDRRVSRCPGVYPSTRKREFLAAEVLGLEERRGLTEGDLELKRRIGSTGGDLDLERKRGSAGGEELVGE